MTIASVRSVSSRVILSLAYISCVLQWLWLLVLGLPAVIESGALNMLTTAPEPVVVEPADVGTDQSLLVVSIVGIVTIFILALSIAVLARLPKVIRDTGEYAVQRTSQAVLPIITQHKPLPAKKKRVVSRRIMLGVRLLMALTPLVLTYFVPAPPELTRQVVDIAALVLALVSVVSFIAAWLLEPATTSRTQSHASRG